VHGKPVWILDRPNPAGRPIEGLLLESGWESFVGAGPMPMRHGLTMGEMARWFVSALKLGTELHVIEMQGWQPNAMPGCGWPTQERSWVNPSPNAPNLSMVRCYSGTVMIEGTTLSEGRGTTRPLELLGAPQLNARALLQWVADFAPQWLLGCTPRECWFEPTFHKHVGKLCNGIQLHVDFPGYGHRAFRPWRLIAALLKACHTLHPELALWRDFAYEYEHDRLAFDLINGGPGLRQWIEDAHSTAGDLETIALAAERAWEERSEEMLIYRD
jgi:uncharacterized protein YbbC (DUF1343 family)